MYLKEINISRNQIRWIYRIFANFVKISSRKKLLENAILQICDSLNVWIAEINSVKNLLNFVLVSRHYYRWQTYWNFLLNAFI